MRELTVLEAAELWLWPDDCGRYLGPMVSPEERERRFHACKHIIPCVGEKGLSSLGPSDIHRMQHEFTALGLMPGTVNAYTHAVFMALVRDVGRAGHCSTEIHERLHAAEMLRVDKGRQWRAYTIAERDHAIDWFTRNTNCGPLVALCLLGGVRSSEAAGLQEQDINWRLETITIERARRASGRITPCKEDGSQRTIPMSDRLLDALLPLRGRGSQWFFPGDGTPELNVQSFRSYVWYPGLKKAGLRRIRLHHCRHVWATIALESGATLAEVAGQLGDTMETVSKTYAHVRPPRNANAAIGEPPPVAPPAHQIPATKGRPSWLRVVK